MINGKANVVRVLADPKRAGVKKRVIDRRIADGVTSVLLAQITGQRFEQREYLVGGELNGRSSTARARVGVG